MQARRAQAVAEEFETMRAIAKKEREVAKKLEAVRIETEARIAKEAAVRDAERKKKVQEKLKKSQAILKEIERKGEESRLRAVEKEKRIQAILEVRSRRGFFVEFGAVRTASSMTWSPRRRRHDPRRVHASRRCRSTQASRRWASSTRA